MLFCQVTLDYPTTIESQEQEEARFLEALAPFVYKVRTIRRGGSFFGPSGGPQVIAVRFFVKPEVVFADLEKAVQGFSTMFPAASGCKLELEDPPPASLWTRLDDAPSSTKSSPPEA